MPVLFSSTNPAVCYDLDIFYVINAAYTRHKTAGYLGLIVNNYRLIEFVFVFVVSVLLQALQHDFCPPLPSQIRTQL